MSAFSLPISPPVPSRAGFIENPSIRGLNINTDIKDHGELIAQDLSIADLSMVQIDMMQRPRMDEFDHGTLRYRLQKQAQSFGTSFKPRYIFGAGTLI